MDLKTMIFHITITLGFVLHHARGFHYVERRSEWNMFSMYSSTEFPYIINETDISPLEKLMIEKAIQEISRETCVNFVPSTKHELSNCPDFTNSVDVFNVYSEYPVERTLCFTKYKRNSTTCSFQYMPFVDIHGQRFYTKVGWIRLDYSPECFNLESLLHEIMHALGFLHEHQRPDRDNHIMIEKKTIENDQELIKINYGIKKIVEKYNTTKIYYDSAYDFCSVMHYGHLLSNITEKCRFKQFDLQTRLSALDIIGINKNYDCRYKNNNQLWYFQPGTAVFRHFQNSDLTNSEVDNSIIISSLTIIAIILNKSKIRGPHSRKCRTLR